MNHFIKLNVNEQQAALLEEALSNIITHAMQQGREEEREACARVCETQKEKLVDRDTNFGMNEAARASLEEAVAAIRARGQGNKKAV